MAHNFRRPKLPYEAESLPNNKRYQLLTRSNKRPPTDVMLDTDVNYLIDAVRQLDKDVAGVVAGAIPGSDDPDNANALVTTDGAGNIGWVKVQDSNIVDHSISRLKLIPQTITTTEIQDGAITRDQLAAEAVGTDELEDGSVTVNKIGSLAVTTPKIAANAVTTDKILDENVTTGKIADSAVTTAKILDANVTASKLAANAVTTVKILDANVTTSKILDENVTTAKLAANAVTAAKIANDAITFTQINSSFTATQAQQQAASSSSVYVSPLRQQYHPSAACAWVGFSGTTGAIDNAYNVSAVEKIGTGIYRITFANAFSNNTYIGVPTIQDTVYRSAQIDSTFPRTTTQVQIKIYSSTSTTSDCDYVNCVFYGALA